MKQYIVYLSMSECLHLITPEQNDDSDFDPTDGPLLEDDTTVYLASDVLVERAELLALVQTLTDSPPVPDWVYEHGCNCEFCKAIDQLIARL